MREALNLNQQGTLESRKQGIAKYEQAIKIYQRQDVRTNFKNARRNEAGLLSFIGTTYSRHWKNE
jgi:hypothetical protein